MGALGGWPEVQGVRQGAQGAAPSLASLEPPGSLPGTQKSERGPRCSLFAVGIWVSYVTNCYVTSCSVCTGSSVALGGGGGSGGGGSGGGGSGGGGQTMGVLWGTGIGQFFFSIRKQHSETDNSIFIFFFHWVMMTPKMISTKLTCSLGIYVS